MVAWSRSTLAAPVDARPTWLLTGLMGEPRAGYAVTPLAEGRVLVCGGKTTSGRPRFAPCELWNADTEAWTPAGGLARPHERPQRLTW